MIDQTITEQINIEAPTSSIWNTLTTPELIKEYLFGTDTFSDWKVGSLIEFKGEFGDTAYHDKGTILKSEENQLFQYSYLSSMSGLEDLPENYAVITFSISESEDAAKLEISQKGFANEMAISHSTAMWKQVLSQIKVITERS